VTGRHLAYALIPITPALWSANYYVAAKAVNEIEPHALALLRWSIALVLMLPFAWPTLARQALPARREWIDYFILGGLGMWVCGAFVYYGGRSTSALNIGLMYALSPVLIALFSSVWLKERFNARQKVGVCMAFAGVIWIVTRGEPATIMHMQWVEGDLWIGVAVLCWTAYSLLLRSRPSSLEPFARLTVITACGVIILIPLAWLESRWVHDWHISWKGLGLAMIAAALPGFGAYQAYSLMQAHLGAARTGVVLYLGPLYAGIMGWLLLDQAIADFHLVGAALILPGVYWVTARSG